MLWPFGKTVTEVDQLKQSDPRDEFRSLAGFMDALPDPVLAIDRSGIVLLANDHVHSVLEVEPQGQHFTAAIRAPSVLEAVTAALTTQSAAHVEYELRVPTPRHFNVFVSPIGGQQPHGPAVLRVLKDLTREQQIERMRADFVANASHELRTPLASLTGFIETLMGAAKDDAAARGKFLELMRGQAARMKRLIDDLLSLSRIELNEHIRPAGTVDLAEVARYAGDILSSLAKAENCELRIDVADGLEVTGDRDELLQVLQNLIENALKYASSGKTVEIKGRRDGAVIELSVRDRGPGIAAEHLPRLTERFYRVNAQESRARGGTGLGLAIVKHILNRHRGRLVITSETGNGSVFSLRIPARKL